MVGAAVEESIATDVTDQERAAAALVLAAAAEELRAHGATVETRIVDGLAGEEIVRFAGDERCDVVVMATHGRSGLRRAVLGSVAEHVVRHLESVPVMLVHPHSDEPAAPGS